MKQTLNFMKVGFHFIKHGFNLANRAEPRPKSGSQLSPVQQSRRAMRARKSEYSGFVPRSIRSIRVLCRALAASRARKGLRPGWNNARVLDVSHCKKMKYVVMTARPPRRCQNPNNRGRITRRAEDGMGCGARRVTACHCLPGRPKKAASDGVYWEGQKNFSESQRAFCSRRQRRDLPRGAGPSCADGVNPLRFSPSVGYAEAGLRETSRPVGPRAPQARRRALWQSRRPVRCRGMCWC